MPLLILPDLPKQSSTIAAGSITGTEEIILKRILMSLPKYKPEK